MRTRRHHLFARRVYRARSWYLACLLATSAVLNVYIVSAFLLGVAPSDLLPFLVLSLTLALLALLS